MQKVEILAQQIFKFLLPNNNGMQVEEGISSFTTQTWKKLAIHILLKFFICLVWIIEKTTSKKEYVCKKDDTTK